MTETRDFFPQSPNTHAHRHSHSQSHSRNGRSSPISNDSPVRDRRGSVVSRLSRVSSSATESHVRHRHLGRRNTVTTYHPEGIEEQSLHPGWQPGAEPGIDTSAKDDAIPEHLTNLKAPCEIVIIDFSDSESQHAVADNVSISAFLDDPRPESLPCRWISVNGLSWDVIKVIGNKYGLHRLAIEDLIHTHSRTKVDWYRDQAFVVLTLQKLVRLHQHDDPIDCPAKESDSAPDNPKGASKRSWWPGGKEKPDVLPRYMDGDQNGVEDVIKAHSGTSEESPIRDIRTLHRYESAQIPEHTAFMERHSALASEDLVVSVEQVSIFLLADNTIISFFEHSADDIEKPIMERLSNNETILRRSCDASLLLQAIIDAIVDLAMPVRDAYNKARKELQIDAMTSPDIRTSRALHIFGEEIDMLQNLFKPIVHLVNALRDHNTEPTPPVAAAPSSPIHPDTNTGENEKPKRHKLEQMKRDRNGAPAFARSVSDFRRLTPLKPTTTPTPGSVTISPIAHTYFGDVLDHCITMIQALEQMDASANNISTLIFNTVGAKTNNFMMILAVVTVFFAPLTFVSGYFGMNFSSGSGLKHPFSFFWVVAIPSLVGFMGLVFGVMTWENIESFFAKRGLRAHRRDRDRRRRG